MPERDVQVLISAYRLLQSVPVAGLLVVHRKMRQEGHENVRIAFCENMCSLGEFIVSS